MSRGAVPPGQRLSKMPETQSAGLLQRLSDRCQIEDLGDVSVVESDDRDVVRHPYAPTTAFKHYPGGEDVLVGKDRLGQLAVVDHAAHGGPTTGDVVGRVAVLDPIRVDAAFGDRPAETISSELALRQVRVRALCLGHVRERSPAALDEMGADEVAGGVVVDDDRVEFRAVAVDQDGRQALREETVGETVVEWYAHDDDAVEAVRDRQRAE